MDASNGSLLYHETCFQLAKSVYEGRSSIDAIQVKPKYDTIPRRDVIAELVGGLEAGLADTTDRKTLTRALWKLIRPDDLGRVGVYTQSEHEAAITAVTCGQVSHSEAISMYGVPERTLGDSMDVIHSLFKVARGKKGREALMNKCVTAAVAVTKAIYERAHARSTSLFTCLLTADQADLVNRVAYLTARTGTAVDMDRLAVLTGHAIRASGEFDLALAGEDVGKQAEAQRKMAAVACRSFLTRNVVKMTRLAELQKSGMRKKSKMAEKRIRAMDPALERIARLKVTAAINKLIQKGMITPAQYADPNRHHNMDEIAQSTNNRHGRVISYGTDANHFDQVVSCPHERSQFHTSVCITSSPGSLKMSQSMLVIHAAASEKTVAGNVYAGLSPNILVATSPSAYNTQSIFWKLMRDFVKTTSASRANPQFYWCDNHESHWCGKAIDWARKHGVYIIFLRSQASSVDQPNDRGVNAFFKWHFDKAYAAHIATFPGITFTRRDLNVVLSAAYASFLADTRLASVVGKAWYVTGLYPFCVADSGGAVDDFVDHRVCIEIREYL